MFLSKYFLVWAAFGLASLGQATSPTGDQDVLNALSKGSMAEAQMGRMVEAQALDPQVKSFGRRMDQDHTAILDQTNAWAKAHGMTVDSSVDPKDKKMFDKMSRLKGQKLDHAYISDMLKDHRKDVDEVAKYINDHPDSRLRPFLVKTLPILENHLRIAENVAGKLGIQPDVGLTKPERPAS